MGGRERGASVMRLVLRRQQSLIIGLYWEVTADITYEFISNLGGMLCLLWSLGDRAGMAPSDRLHGTP